MISRKGAKNAKIRNFALLAALREISHPINPERL